MLNGYLHGAVVIISSLQYMMYVPVHGGFHAGYIYYSYWFVREKEVEDGQRVSAQANYNRQRWLPG